MIPAFELLVFSGVMAAGQFSPGPDMILLTRTSLAEGAKAGAAMACGIATGLAVHTAVAVAGLALAFEKLPALRKLVAWLAAGYLLWLAYRLLMEHFVAWYSGAKADQPVTPAGRPYVRGLICNLLNPKAVIFLAAVCAPFLHGDRPSWWPLALWGIVVFQGGILWALWAWLLQWKPLRSRYERASKWIDGVFAIALAGLAVNLLLAA